MDVAGLVSSIITFVDFSWTIVRGTYDVHSSASGATEENVHIGNVIEDLRQVTDKMRVEVPGQGEHEKALIELGRQCHGLSSDLAHILQKLTTRRRSGLQSLNVVLRSLMKEKEVRDIERRLGEYRGQMLLRLNLMLVERSGTMQDSLRSIHEAQTPKLRDLKQRAESLTDNDFVLRRLYFNEIYARAENVTVATDGTFERLLADDDASIRRITLEQTWNYDPFGSGGRRWDRYKERRLLQESAAKISEFLEHARGVFFLRGKPGSGKSTLMKYLVDGRGQQKTNCKLQKWAGQKRLIRISTMFFLHGTPLQRSLEGFYRAFFFELILQCPEFAEILFPQRSTGEFCDDSYRSSFPLKTLHEAWANFTSISSHATLRICVFIDGLDELEGSSRDRMDFARTLSEWAHSEDIKIICSGRPNAEFNEVFKQPQNRIDLQDLTMSDIQEILEKRFQGLRQLSDLTDDDFETLINTITYQSEGVILWAVLVAKDLEDDIIHGSSLNVMKRKIEKLPPGIEDLFNGMLQDFRPGAQQHLMLTTIFEILSVNNIHFGAVRTLALGFSWLEEVLSDPEFPYNEPIKVLPATELDSRLDKVRRQLARWTKHLVEVSDVYLSPWKEAERYLYEECRFVHRSAQEFVQSKLELTASEKVPSNHTVEVMFRLQLIFDISTRRELVLHYFSQLALFFRQERHGWPCQFQYRGMEKLRELMEARSSSHSGDDTAGPFDRANWPSLRLPRPLSSRIMKKTTLALFHVAISSHQVDYINRLFNDRTQQLDREVVNLGLLICGIDGCPSSELFKLFVDHGADLDYPVEIYGPPRKSDPELVPLWLAFICHLAYYMSSWSCDYLLEIWKERPSTEFTMLEILLRLGRGANVRFLAKPSSRDPGPIEVKLFVMDLAQVVRYAEPANMESLLLLLEPQPATIFSTVERLINAVLQPQFPLRTLPQGATTLPCRTVPDQYLRGRT